MFSLSGNRVDAFFCYVSRSRRAHRCSTKFVGENSPPAEAMTGLDRLKLWPIRRLLREMLSRSTSIRVNRQSLPHLFSEKSLVFPPGLLVFPTLREDSSCANGPVYPAGNDWRAGAGRAGGGTIYDIRIGDRSRYPRAPPSG